MWLLKNENTGQEFYLLRNKAQYTISRRAENADLILTDDDSISREHATLSPQIDHVMVIDAKSKYGTYLNEKIDANICIAKNVEHPLKAGDRIRFGRLRNVWRLHCIELKVLSSTLTPHEKMEVKKNLDILGGQFLDEWNDECTHLTVQNLTATIKVLQSLVHCIPIVRPDYWSDYIKCIKSNAGQIPPDVDKYLPTDVEEFTKNISYSVNIERKRLFANKTFIFMIKSHMMKFEKLIQLAGGCCYSLDERRIRKTSLTKPDTIVVQYNPLTESQASVDISHISDYLKSQQKRTIPDCDIGLAILHCSTVKFCNVDYKMDEIFIQNNLLMATPSTVLAKETPNQTEKQLQQQQHNLNLALNLMIPETVEQTMESPQISDSMLSSSIGINDGGKRKNSDDPNELDGPRKKMALDWKSPTSEIFNIPTIDEFDMNIEHDQCEKSINLGVDDNNLFDMENVEEENCPKSKNKNVQLMNTKTNASKSVAKPLQTKTTSTATATATTSAAREAPTTTTTTTQTTSAKTTNKRSFATLRNTNNNAEDNLFDFDIDIPKSKKSKPSTSTKNTQNTNPLDFPSSTSQSQYSQSQKDKENQQNTSSANAHNAEQDYSKYIDAIRIEPEPNLVWIPWIKKEPHQFPLDPIEIEDGNNSDDEDDKQTKKLFIKPINVSIMNATFLNRPNRSDVNESNGSQSFKGAGFKGFVKKNNFLPQMTVIRTNEEIGVHLSH